MGKQKFGSVLKKLALKPLAKSVINNYKGV